MGRRMVVDGQSKQIRRSDQSTGFYVERHRQEEGWGGVFKVWITLLVLFMIIWVEVDLDEHRRSPQLADRSQAISSPGYNERSPGHIGMFGCEIFNLDIDVRDHLRGKRKADENRDSFFCENYTQ